MTRRATRRTGRHARPQQPSAPAGAGIWWPAGILAVAGFAVYANSLSGPFVLDDRISIAANDAIREWWNLPRVFAQPINTPFAGRPLVALSFALNYAFGGLAVEGYHLVNIALHLACALLLFGSVRRTLLLPSLRKDWGQNATPAGFAVALAWTLHPLNTEAVDYLTQRTESMMALFYLGVLYAGIRSLGSRRSAAWQAGAVASCAFGMACKESMVTAPVLLLLYDRVFVFDSTSEALSSRWRLYGALAMTWLVLAYLALPGPRSNSVGFATAVSPYTYLLNQAVMVARYFRLSFWPSGLVLNYGPVVDLSLREVWPQALVVIGTIAFAIVASLRWKVVGFLAAWVFITLAPTSSVVPIATEVGAERRMYLPLMAMSSLVVLLAIRIAESRARSVVSGWPAALFAAAALALGAATIQRNREYQSTLVLAETVLQRWPTGVAHQMVGAELSMLDRHDEAIAELREAVRTYSRARYNLGVALFNAKRFDEAARELRAFAAEHPSLAEVPSARTIAGDAFRLQGDWSDAIREYRLALSMAPADVETKASLAAVLINQGVDFARAQQFDEAIAAFRQAASLDPRNADAQKNLAAASLERGDLTGAANAANAAVAINPADADAHDLLGMSLAMQERLDEAAAEFERALRLDPSHAQAAEHLALARGARKP